MGHKFMLPGHCCYCGEKLNDKELVELDDYEVFHPICYMTMKNQDLLKAMFTLQKEFQKSLGTKFNQSFITTMTIAAVDELMEALHETPWKPWKKNQEFNKQKYKEELVDVFHFFMNLCLAADMKPEELYTLYFKKINKNRIRQKRNY